MESMILMVWSCNKNGFMIQQNFDHFFHSVPIKNNLLLVFGMIYSNAYIPSILVEFCSMLTISVSINPLRDETSNENTTEANFCPKFFSIISKTSLLIDGIDKFSILCFPIHANHQRIYNKNSITILNFTKLLKSHYFCLNAIVDI